MKKIDNMEIICDYGCGQIAKYQFKNGKFCCCKSQNACPSKKKRSAESGIGKKHALASSIKTEELCSFGCGQQAKFIYKNTSYCCSDDWHRCPNKRKEIQKRTGLIWSDLDRRKRLSETQRKDLIAKPIPILNKYKKCFYCGERANFWFQTNDKYCCSNRIERCSVNRKQISNRTKKLWKDDEFREKILNQDYNEPERIRKQTEGWKKWYENKDNRDAILERNRKLADYRRGKTWEELYGEDKAKELKGMHSNRTLGKTYEDLYGEEKAREMKENISNRLSGKSHIELYGKEKACELSKIMSEKKKEHWKDIDSSYNSNEFRKKKSIEAINKWKDSEYTSKIQEGLHSSPNKVEQFLIKLIDELGLEYNFVGDWSLNINGRNPDFVNNKQKKLIEHFGVYYHDTIVEETRKEHEKERVDFFSEHGYKTLIIWEDEIENIEKLKEKIIKFDKK